MILLSFLCVFPIYWMVVTSLKADSEIFSTALWPSHPSLENYACMFAKMPILRILAITVIVAATTAGLQVLTGLLAAYALVYWRLRLWRFRAWVDRAFVAGAVPGDDDPNYVFASKLGVLDSLSGLVIPNAVAAFAVLLLYHSMRSFPTEVLEAARMDGARHWRVLWDIVAPNMRAPIASLAILAFISAWNEYFWPLLLSRKVENSVVQIGLRDVSDAGRQSVGAADGGRNACQLADPADLPCSAAARRSNPS